MSGEEIIRAFLREFPNLVLTREQQDWLEAEIEKAIDEGGDDDDFDY